ncbi:MAG: glycosyl transferase [Acidiferrobacteraceae bacterium]|nr:glycosyl transferase [Acidiferrobacteraceae bacterium]
MKIGFYAPMKAPDYPSPSGDRTIARLLIEAMTQAGHDVRLMSQHRSIDIGGDLENQGKIREQSASEVARILDQLPHHSNSIDLWFTYHLSHKAPDWLGPEVCEEFGIPYVVAEASYAPKQKNGPWREGLSSVETALGHAAGIISLNPRDHECIQPFLKLKAKQLSLLPFTHENALPSDRRGQLKQELGRKLDTDSEQPWLVTVAMMRRGDKQRSFSMLAEALDVVTDLAWRLIIIGDGEAAQEAKDAFASLGQERVYFAGQLTTDKVHPYLNAADIFVWPAINEAFGMSLLEAQGHALPVVAGHTDGTATIVQDEHTGILTEPENTAAFSQALRRLLQNSELREHMGQNARQKFLSCHTLKSASQKIDTLLRSLTSE